MPLLDVRANLPSSAEMGNIGMSGGNMGGNMGGGGGVGNNMSGGGNQGNNAANVGTAALQAALATIMGMSSSGSMSGSDQQHSNTNRTGMAGMNMMNNGG